MYTNLWFAYIGILPNFNKKGGNADEKIFNY
nr:MAG TPA: hypothetical protein [Caudoviricetes sp.]